MPPLSRRAVRQIQALLALASAISGAAALWRCLPRLTAGPICSSSQDVLAFAGHCPACFVAAGFILAFLASVAILPRAGRAGLAAIA